MTEPTEPSVCFRASDGWTLMGDLFAPTNPACAIVISAGTGFPRKFYRHAAAWFAQQGAAVLTYDYRGIGGSACNDLRASGIDYPDWGRYDLTAAVETLAQRYPNLPIMHVAHSVGGHFVGLIPNHAKIARHAFVSVGTGYFGRHHARNVPLEMYFWWGMGSYSLWRHGYIKPVGGWRGEPLPPKLFQSWRRWSHCRSYFQPELKTSMAPHYYSEVSAPIHSWVFSDDPIATEKTARDILECYPNAPSVIELLRPNDIGRKSIGHDGGFRKGSEALWQRIWSFLMI